jgi:hypothetical protein
MKRGTATVTADELKAAIRADAGAGGGAADVPSADRLPRGAASHGRRPGRPRPRG